MDLKDAQRLFARLAVDARFRERAFSSPDGEAAVFAGLGKELVRSASSLIHKRKNAVRSALPATCRGLGPAFEEEFRAYADTHEEPRGVHRHRLDALAFAAWLTKQVGSGIHPAPLRDLLSHETAPLTMWVEGRRLLLRLHRRHPAMLSKLVSTGCEEWRSAPVRPAVLVWWSSSEAAGGYRWSSILPW